MRPGPDASPGEVDAPVPVTQAGPGRPSAWLRLGVPLLLVLVTSVVFGVTTARADLSLGPHEARYDVTTDGTATLDLGPLGTLEVDAPVPLGLGVRVTVQEIPASVTSVDQATTLAALGGDLQAYLQFFAGPQATVEDAVRALVADAARRTVLALVLLVALGAGGRALLGADRRRELGEALAPHAHRIVAGGTVVVVGLGVLSASEGDPVTDGSTEVASAVFAGTPLEGARVTGRLGGVIDTYGGYAVEAYRSNTEFYARADDALVVAWEERSARIEQAREQAARIDQAARAVEGAQATSGSDDAGSDGAATPGAGSAEAGAGATSTPSGEATASAPPGPTDEASTAGPSPDPTEDEPADPPAEPVVLVLMTDLHCNVGMEPVISSLVELADADVLLDGGDTTIDGTAVEQYCVTTFARAAGGVPVVVSPGNHDSRETEQAYRRAGATVLGGEVVEVAGVRILGDRDPHETRIGAGTTRSGQESADEVGTRLGEVACDADDGIDLLLIHTPRVGDAAVEQGCVPAQLSGHQHRRVGPDRVGSSVRYVGSSAAGAESGQPTVGPLRGTAELTVLRFDPDERRFLDYQVVQVRTDASVSVGARVPWPHVLPESSPAGTS